MKPLKRIAMLYAEYNLKIQQYQIFPKQNSLLNILSRN